MALNSQNLTASGMGQLAEDQMKQRVLDQAVANPNQLQTGGQLGATPTNGMIAPTPINYQAIYNDQPNVAPDMSHAGQTFDPLTGQWLERSGVSGFQGSAASIAANKAVSDAVGSEQSQGSLTSAPAKAFVQNAKTSLESQQADLQRALGSFNIQKSAQEQFDVNKKKVEEQFKPVEDVTAERQASETETQKAAEFYAGRSGGTYAEATLKKLQVQQERELTALALKKKEAIDKAWDSALTGQVEQYQQYEKEAKAVQDEITKSKEKADTSQKDILALQAAETKEGGAVYSLVQAGREPTENQLQSLDTMRGYNPGTSRMLYDATKAVFDRTQKKEDREAFSSELNIQKSLADLEDRPMDRQSKLLDIQTKLQASKTRVYDEMGKIFDVMEKAPPGFKFNIGDASYFGIEGNAVFEKDKSGQGRIAYKDMSGNYKTQSLGFMGDPNDLETVYVDGQPVVRNKNTKQEVSISTSAGVSSTDTGWDTAFPVGSKGGQCGAFCHNFVSDYPMGLNTLKQKLSVVNVPQGELPQTGDVGFQAIGGESGHAFVVQGTFKGSDGKDWISYIDSNRGMDERVRVGTMPADTATLRGYFRGSIRPNMVTGTDAPTSNEPQEMNPFIARGIAMTDAQMQKAQDKWDQAKTLAADLLDGVDEKELFKGVPADIRNEARRAAKNQEYQQFSQEYTSNFAGPFTKKELDKEFENYQKAKKASTSDNPKEIAQNIFDGFSNIKISNLPQDQRTAVDNELAALRRKATDSGNTVGVLRASAGGEKVSDAFMTAYEKSSNVLSQIGDIQQLIKGADTGPIKGILSSRNPYDAKAREIQAKLTAIVPNLARGVYGEVGVLTDQDVALYSKTLPNLSDTQAVNNAILSATLRSVANSLESKLLTQANGNRDVSGYIDSYMQLKNKANQLLADANPKVYRVVDGELYEKSGTNWVLKK